MQGQFSDEALEQALFEFIENGDIADYDEYFDFGATCMKPDGTLYGISKGKCRQGTETSKAAPKPKRGRPPGGKNVAKAAPGDAAARMKAAYDRLVGMDLSKKPTMVTEQPSITPSNLKARMDAVNAKLGKAGDEMAKYEDASGHVRPENKAAWNKAHDSYSRHASERKRLIDAEYAFKKRQDEVAAQMNRIGGEHMREKDPAKKAQLEAEYAKYESVYKKLAQAQTQEGTNTWMAKLGISERPPTLSEIKTAAATKGKITQAKELDDAIAAKIKEQNGAMVGSKLASMIEKRNKLKKEIIEDNVQPKKAVTPTAKASEQLSEQQKKAVAAQEKAYASYNKAVEAEDAAYKKLMAAKDDGQSFEARKPLRDEHKRLEKIAAEKFEVLKKADVELNEIRNRGQELVDRPSDRNSLRQIRQEARDYEALRKRMMFAGEKPSEIQKAEVHLSAAKSIIRHQKEVQDDRIVASMNRSNAGKELHRLNQIPQRKAAIENVKIKKLMEIKRNTSDPKKIKKLDQQIKEANERRLLMLKEVENNNNRFAARKAASEAAAKALVAADPKNATKIRNMEQNVSVMNQVVAAKGNEIDRIERGIVSLELHQQSIDKRMRDNQERANKYASMIRNAKSPSEKQLLEEAFKKRQPELNRAAMSAMKAANDNEAKLVSLRQRGDKERDALEKALAERNKYKRDLDKIQAEGTLASDKTKYARREAADVMRQLDAARGAGNRIETLGGNKPEFNMAVGTGTGSKRLGQGAYGATFKLPGPPPATVKYGLIGRDEVTAMQKMAALGLAPNVLKGERVVGSGENAGRFAYEYAKGRPMMDLANAGQVTRTMKDEFWAARAQMHRTGIAHNDLHPGNVIVGDDGKVKFIDFGLARIGTRAALGEALGLDRAPGGTFNRWSNSGDKQIKRWGEAYGPSNGRNPQNLQRILDNRKKVEEAMRQDGLPDKTIDFLMKGGNYFRQPDSYFERGPWQTVSDGAAQRYIDILYNGVV